MLDIWSWICELPNSQEWADSNSNTNSFSPLVFELVNSEKTRRSNKTTHSIYLKAERTSGSNTEAMVTFSVCIQGFHPHISQKTLWVSETCPLSSQNPFLPLVLQLLNETITRSPTANVSTCPRSQLQKLKPEPVSWVMQTHSLESFSSFFSLIFLTRLFWLCAFDVPSEVGTLYFQSLLAPNMESFSSSHMPVLRTFFISVGVDAELCFMRAVGYMLSKWLILRELKVGVGLKTLAPLPNVGFSYANEVHGLWVIKGYMPVLAMDVCNGHKSHFPIVEAKESLLRYALAHQQLETVIQVEYSVVFHEEGYVQVKTRIDNMRFHVVRLGYNKNEESGLLDERYFPTRIKVWVGPEVGATYVGGLTLGRSTDNGQKETEVQRIVKGTFAKSKMSKVKARARMATRTKIKNWRWDQDAEGNAVVFDAVLCDNNIHGHELSSSNTMDSGFRQRYTSNNRPFTKSGGVVFAGDQYGEEAGWRLSREIEGSVLKWRIGGQVWLNYVPNDVNSSRPETRTVEWCDEVDLPLITSNVVK